MFLFSYEFIYLDLEVNIINDNLIIILYITLFIQVIASCH